MRVNPAAESRLRDDKVAITKNLKGPIVSSPNRPDLAVVLKLERLRGLSRNGKDDVLVQPEILLLGVEPVESLAASIHHNGLGGEVVVERLLAELAPDSRVLDPTPR